MKRILCIILAALLVCLSGCGAAPKNDKIQVIAAIFPQYDWARQIIGDSENVELNLLMDDGVDPHSFQPAVSDLVAVSNCDLLIYGGGESDNWLINSEQSNPNRTMLALLPLLGEKVHTEEVVEGMQHHHEEEEAADEHFWLSLDYAAHCCQAIAQELCRLDPENKEVYQKNLESYEQQLASLHADYQKTVDGAARDTILVCDRFPFRYLTEDYRLNYYAAFPGCSAECEASFETILFLSEKAKELELDTLLITETGDSRIARSVAENADKKDMEILVLDAMQSVSLKDAAQRSYLGTMEENLKVLSAALN